MDKENTKNNVGGAVTWKVVLLSVAVTFVSFAAYVALNSGGNGLFILSTASASEEGGGHGEAKKEEHGGGGKKPAEGGQGEAKKETKAEGPAVNPTDQSRMEAEIRKRQAAEARRELDGLEEKRIQIKKQEEKLKAEQERMLQLKQELSDKISELETMHRKIDESLQKIDLKRTEKDAASKAEQEKKIKQLVKMYSTMKPKQAGVIFNSMDIVIAEKILMNMKGDAAGKILAYVDGPRAALISERLAISVGRSQGVP
jgi:flagellar motility protein MotE (MotC chaperone)